MTKEEVMNNMKFRQKCISFGLNWDDFYIVDDVIVVNTPKDGISFFLDEHYNVFWIYDENERYYKYDSIDDAIACEKMRYKEENNFIYFPFRYINMKQMVELSNRVFIHDVNHGHSSEVIVNGEVVEDKYGNDYVNLLSYIKFLGRHIEKYYKDVYHLKMNLNEYFYPTVFLYLHRILANIDECVNKFIQRGVRPFPIDIIRYLGEDIASLDKCSHELFYVIDLLLKLDGFKVVGDNSIIKIDDVNDTDLEDKTMRLVRLLDVSDEEVELREGSGPLCINRVNLESYLSKYEIEKVNDGIYVRRRFKDMK